MYEVSEAYKEAMHAKVQRFRMVGNIGTTSFTDENILAGSFSITNQCSSNEAVSIGQVYVGELNATFVNLKMIRHTLKGTSIRPRFGLKLSDGTYEYIPLGVFKIEEAKWTQSGLVVKAYDNMAEFDKTINITQTAGKLADILALVCDDCGVEIGMTDEELEALPNGNVSISCYTENDIETYRDYLSWLAQACGCNALIDRSGKLILKKYTQLSVDKIDTAHRFSGAEFSDFVTKYTGVSCVNIETKETKYYAVEPDDGLTYNLGTNPFLQYGIEENQDTMRKNVLEALQGIKYVPFSVNMIGNPAYDLMDVLEFVDGVAGSSALSCITKYTFNYHGQYQASGVGSNPALASAKSKTDKNIQGLISSTDSKTIQYTIFENSDDLDVADGKSVQIMKIRFATVERTTVVFQCEILADVSTTSRLSTFNDAVSTVTYYLDDEEVTERHPVETWQDGQHILGLRYAIQSLSSAVHRFAVAITMNGGAMHIDPRGIHAIIIGQGMASEAAWDGTIEAEDKFDLFCLSGRFMDYADTMALGFITPTKPTANDKFTSFSMSSQFRQFSDGLKLSNLIFSTTSNTEQLTVTAEELAEVWTNGDVITPELSDVREIVINSTDLTTFQVSFDQGKSWSAWTGSEWSAGGIMYARFFQTIPESEFAGKNTMIKAHMTASDKLTSIIIYR